MIDENTITQARALVENFEAGDHEAAQSNLDRLTSVSHSNLFNEVGKLTRELHDTLNNFTLDTRLSSLAVQDIPDAKDRLEYVLTLTADAANKTMDAVEEGLSINDRIKGKAGILDTGWKKVRAKECSGEQFRDLCSSTEDFLASTATDSVLLHSVLQDALMAQDYQDLTGQVIKRVIQLVHEVEESLVGTIKMFGEMSDEKKTSATAEQPTKSTGPAMNATTRDDVVANQDEVDDLLSSLGF